MVALFKSTALFSLIFLTLPTFAGASPLCSNILAGKSDGPRSSAPRLIVTGGPHFERYGRLVEPKIKLFLSQLYQIIPESLLAELKVIHVKIEENENEASHSASQDINEISLSVPLSVLMKPNSIFKRKKWRSVLVALGHEVGHLVFNRKLRSEFPELEAYLQYRDRFKYWKKIESNL